MVGKKFDFQIMLELSQEGPVTNGLPRLVYDSIQVCSFYEDPDISWAMVMAPTIEDVRDRTDRTVI